jgi:transposase
MQEKSFRLHNAKVGPIPIVRKFLADLGLKDLLLDALKHEGAAAAIETLAMSILLKPNALYRVGQWAKDFDEGLACRALSDDATGRALDRLFKADRASLLTKITVSAIKKYGVNVDQIHNDSTSVKFCGAYAEQNPKAVQLKRGHSKDHRPDLKQLVYSLSVTRDGAIPIHFKAYDGNRTDDTTHWEIWQNLRGLLGRSDFLYVADSKLCVTETMKNIDRDQGYFVTIVPKTRLEVGEFADKVLAAQVRWKPLWQKRSTREKRKIDHFEVADGFFQLREGYRVYWYRSSEKMTRDTQDRADRMSIARTQLLRLNDIKRRGPKSEAALLKAAAKILVRYGAKDWLTVEVQSTEVEKFRQTRRGKATGNSLFKRTIHKVFTITVSDNAEALARAQAMDGIFPLTTNKDITALDVLKAYKFQPHLEKRHSLFKTILEVAPVFLKKNERIESLVFVYFIAQLVASLIERKLRAAMAAEEIESLPILPEGRPTKTPTAACVFDQFEHRSRHYLFKDDRLIQTFADPLSEVQNDLLKLLETPITAYQ